MKVLAFTKYGSLAASTRQRFELYEPALRRAGIELDYAPLLGNDYLKPLSIGKRPPAKTVAKGYGSRLGKLFGARGYDALWVHCEYFPYLPGWIEAAAAGIAGRPFIFDYDDAIFHMYDESRSVAVRAMLSDKLKPLLSRASACTCGNDYLRAYAAQYCANSLVVPTVVDTDAYAPALHKAGDPLTIGWIGSPSSWPNVRPLLPLLAELCRDHQAQFRVVGAGKAAAGDRFSGMEMVDWSEESEIAEVQRMDIGIMPLDDLPFQRGKSGFKLIQYMACALPVLASPVGVNRQIVEPGRNGFLASSTSEWQEALARLLTDVSLRASLGEAGRAKAVAQYSLASQAPRLVELFRSLARSG